MHKLRVTLYNAENGSALSSHLSETHANPFEDMLAESVNQFKREGLSSPDESHRIKGTEQESGKQLYDIKYTYPYCYAYTLELQEFIIQKDFYFKNINDIPDSN